jgi:hypothetical protein
MFVPFESLPNHSRLWIYQASRKISNSEKDIISQTLTSFTQQWLVHGEPMMASFTVCDDQFIVLAADEGYNAASGCSIDGSVRTLKSLGQQLGIDFFDRTKVAFKKEKEIVLIPVSELKQKNIEGVWNENSLTFNNLVATKGEFNATWIIPAAGTWLTRYLPVTKTVNL